ncbi:hypothetical protein AaE_002277, partial [Aphanomyces astaci]
MTSNGMAADSVGIEWFCSQHADGFSGVIKSTPEDFQVREVSMDGEIVDLPSDRRQEGHIAPSPPLSQPKPTISVAVHEPSEGWEAFLASKLSPDVIQTIANIMLETVEEVDVPAPADLSDKVHLLHAIQHRFPGVQSNNAKDAATGQVSIKLSLDPVYRKLRRGGVDVDDCSVILSFLLRGPMDAQAEAGTRGAWRRQVQRSAHPRTSRLVVCQQLFGLENLRHWRGPRVLFAQNSAATKAQTRHESFVYVEKGNPSTNMDHFTALDVLARACHASVSDFSFAGTKDKRAVTYQHVVAKNVSHEVLTSVQDKLEVQGLQVGALRYVERPLALGQSRGNRFVYRIVYDSHSTSSRVSAGGGQGDSERDPAAVPTRSHHIGRAMLQQDWPEALRLLFSQTQAQDLNLAAKQAFLDTRNIAQALKDLPPKCVNERTVLM